MVQAAAILAGGEGRRLGGRNKALMQVAGTAIVERQLAVLRCYYQDILVVCKEVSAFSSLAVRAVVDDGPSLGPLSGLATALRVTQAERLLVLACDLPFVDDDVVRRLRAESGSDAVVAKSRTVVQPLCAVYAGTILPLLQRQLRSGDRSLTGLLAHLRVQTIDCDERQLCNLNSAADLAQANQRTLGEIW